MHKCLHIKSNCIGNCSIMRVIILFDSVSNAWNEMYIILRTRSEKSIRVKFLSF